MLLTLKNNMLREKRQIQKVHIVAFNLYEYKYRRGKLIHGKANQYSGSLGREPLDRDSLERSTIGLSGKMKTFVC